MRVLILSWEYAPHMIGGLGKHVLELAPALVGHGCQVHVLTPRLKGGTVREITPEGVHVHRVSVPEMPEYGFISQNQAINNLLEQAGIALAVETGGFDLIHVHDWLTAISGIALKHVWHCPMVATIHATERGRGQGRLLGPQAERINTIEWSLTYEAWRVIACSHFMAAQVNDYFQTPYDKIDVIPNGVRIVPDPFASNQEREQFRSHYAEGTQPIVYYVGRVVYEKGLHVLLDAWPRVIRSYPGARLLIAGSGPYLDELNDQARWLGISDSVIFAGFISDQDRDRFYHVASTAAFPSLYEPFGMVALEAMAARCPVVVSATGGLTEVVKPHETGLTVQPGNPQSLAWGLLHTLQYTDWTAKRVENAFVEARDEFGWAKIAASTAAIYRRVKNAHDADGWGKARIEG